MANTSPLQLDPLVSILERLNGTVAQVFQLRQYLGKLEIELIETRNQCENARAVAAATATKAHGGDRNTVIQNILAPEGCPNPVSLQSPEIHRDPIRPGTKQKTIDRRTKTPKSEPRHDPKSNTVRKSASLSTKTKAGPSSSPSSGISSSLRIPGGSGLPARRVVKAGNSLEVSRPQFTTTPTKPQLQGVVASGPVCKNAKKPPTPTQIPFQRPPQPPIQPSPFSKYVDRSTYPPELKHEGDDWFVFYNLSPKAKRVLDMNLVHTLMHDSKVVCAKFSRDGKWLATGCYRTVQIYDVETGVKTCVLDHGHDGYIGSATFSPDGKYLATGGENKQVTVWEIANQQIHDVFKGHQATVLSVHFSPNGKYIISGSRDATVRIWDRHDRTFKVLTMDGHYLSLDHTVLSVAISPDGRHIAVGSLDTAVSIWEIPTGVLVQTLRGHTKGVGSVAFTPDGKGLISACWDATMKYWDVSRLGIGSGASTALTSTLGASSSPCLMNFTVREYPIFSVAISHDGTWIVSGAYDRNLLFWDIRTGVAECMLSAHMSYVQGVDMSPIGNLLATASGDQRVRIWTYGPS